MEYSIISDPIGAGMQQILSIVNVVDFEGIQCAFESVSFRISTGLVGFPWRHPAVGSKMLTPIV
jgi:hypothetical protein